MNRNAEYSALRDSLSQTPAALASTLTRVKARAIKNSRTKKFVAAPFACVLALFMALVVLVNSSTALAYAVGQVPFLGSLAKAVAFSESLKAAVENQYVQPVNLEQTQNGITMKIEYLIVDKKQVNVFYSLTGEGYESLRADVYVASKELDGFGSGGNWSDEKLQCFTVDFITRDVPSKMSLEAKVFESKIVEAQLPPEPVNSPSFETDWPKTDYIASFTFGLQFDPQYTQTGYTVQVDKWIALDGQRILIKQLEVYPTQIRVLLEDGEANTAWLHSLQFSLIGEDGTVIEKVKNGVSATGSENSPFMAAHHLQSNYFKEGGPFKLCITGASWLDKAHEYFNIDLENGTAEYLPQGIAIKSCMHTENGWLLEFLIKKDPQATFSLPFYPSYVGKDGVAHDINSTSYGNFEDDESAAWIRFALVNYHENSAKLRLWYNRVTEFEKPIEIPIVLGEK